MKNIVLHLLILYVLMTAACAGTDKTTSRFDFAGPRDPSLIRGFNYTPANASFSATSYRSGGFNYDYVNNCI